MIRPGNTPSVRVAERLGFAVGRRDALFEDPSGDRVRAGTA
jgi:RimJ/RimL family protein N-acetyltransferase